MVIFIVKNRPSADNGCNFRPRDKTIASQRSIFPEYSHPDAAVLAPMERLAAALLVLKRNRPLPQRSATIVDRAKEAFDIVRLDAV
jgi:hypothetical protein